MIPAKFKTVPAHVLLSLLLLSLLPATPELAIRSTLTLAGTETVCILTTSTITQALYNSLKLLVRQLVPAVLVILAATAHCRLLGGRLRPPQEERSVSLTVPFTTSWTFVVFRPDILQDTSTQVMLEENRQILEEKPSSSMSEDPTRRVYKRAMTIMFLLANISSMLVDILSQVR